MERIHAGRPAPSSGNVSMTKRWGVVLLLVLVVVSPRTAGPTVTIDTTSPSGKVSPLFYGLMTEEINHADHGGLYAELVRNRAFLDDAATAAHWSLVQTDGSTGTLALDPKGAAQHDPIGTSLRLNVTQGARPVHVAGIANEGYWGIAGQTADPLPRLVLREGRAGIHRTSSSLAIQSEDGGTSRDQECRRVTSAGSSTDLTLRTGKVDPDDESTLRPTVERPGTVWFRLVSLFPPTLKDQPNGPRRTYADDGDMKPSSCVSPEATTSKGTRLPTGSSGRRPWARSLIALGTWGRGAIGRADGMGLKEFLLWAEGIDADRCWACTRATRSRRVRESRSGSATIRAGRARRNRVCSRAATQWAPGRRRATRSRSRWRYVEVGNEDWFDRSGTYDSASRNSTLRSRRGIRGSRSSRPSGNEQPPGRRVHSAQPDVLDEHYYRSVEAFLKMARGHYERLRPAGAGDLRRRVGRLRNAFEPWNPRCPASRPRRHARRHRGRRLHNGDGAERGSRRDEVLRADVRQRESGCAPMAAEPNRV